MWPLRVNSPSFVHTSSRNFLLVKFYFFFWYFATCDSKLSLSAGPAYIAFCLRPASLLSPSVRGDLDLCRHPPRSVICCWWLWCIRGSGPWGSLFVWAMCSQSLQSWQESFTAKHIVCSVPHLHTNHSCSFTFSVLGRRRCNGVKFACLPLVPCVCLFVYWSHQVSRFRIAVGN